MRTNRFSISFEGESSLTKQCHKDECDVNKIVKRFKKAQGIDLLQSLDGYAAGRYGDFSQVPDYREALHQVRKAEETFMRLPAQLRFKFDNDPANFLDFCQDPKNGDEMIKLGLREPPPPPEAAPVPAA